MKIAICLSGFIRTWEYSKISFIKNLVQNLDCDVFIHTYKQNYFEYSAMKKDVIYSEDEILKMFEDINVKGIVIEDRDITKKEIEISTRKYENVTLYKNRIKESSEEIDNFVNLGIRIYDQLRKIHLCNELRKDYQLKNNIKYDLIVKSRFDVLYVDKINWDINFEDNIAYIGEGGCGGFPDDLVGIGKEDPMNAYMDRFLNLEKMCFSTVHRNDFNHINWYWNRDNIFPISEFCAHQTLITNIIYNGYDIKKGGFLNKLIRNENQILNWQHLKIDGVHVEPSRLTNGVILSGDNSFFDVRSFNNKLK